MKITQVFLHHTAVSYKQNPNQAKQTNEYHKKFAMQSSLGYWIGYTYEMNAKGEILQARKDGEEQAAQKGFNKDSISICLDMNGDTEYPTPEQIKSLKSFLKEKLTEYQLTWSEVLFHGDVAHKSCPGHLITRNWLVTELLKV